MYPPIFRNVFTYKGLWVFFILHKIVWPFAVHQAYTYPFSYKIGHIFWLSAKNHFRSWIYTLGDTTYKNSSFKGLFIIIKKLIIITETLKINQYFNNIICPIYRNKAQLVVGKCPWQWKSVTGSISPATESPEGSPTSNFPQHGTYINW